MLGITVFTSVTSYAISLIVFVSGVENGVYFVGLGLPLIVSGIFAIPVITIASVISFFTKRWSSLIKLNLVTSVVLSAIAKFFEGVGRF